MKKPMIWSALTFGVSVALVACSGSDTSMDGSGGMSGPPAADGQQSLPERVDPRPGPDILYAAAPSAPQLENTGAWDAKPILISGASAYRQGEFLYQDYLYDDHGANGLLVDPNDPRTGDDIFSRPGGSYTYPSASDYANNAADLVEFRLEPRADNTAIRVTLNTLLDPELVAFTIAIGDSDAAMDWPHGANVSSPAAWFLTVHGDEAELVDAASGEPLAEQPSVTVDTQRRQFDIRIPHRAFDPGRSTVAFAIGVGLWDAEGGQYLVPGPTRSEAAPGGAGTLPSPAAFFNVGLRFDEPFPNITDPTEPLVAPAWWRDQAQAQALANNDMSPFRVDIDFAKLADDVNDDMPSSAQGVPQTGPMNRILVSHFETEQGAVYPSGCGGPDTCLGALRGRLLPYAIYVPDKPKPADGFGLTLLLHSLGANYNQYSDSRNQSQLGDRGDGHIVITPAGRGPDGWYVEYAATETFEVWADVARNYELDPDKTVTTGYSMGGYGSFRFATRFPDLFAKVQTTVGPPAIGAWVPPAPPSGGEESNTFHQLEGLRNIPILMWVMLADELVPYPSTTEQTGRLDELGYRYTFNTFTPGEHLTLAVNDQYAPVAEFLGDATVERNPARVCFVRNPEMDFPDVGIVGDHAYWVSDIAVRDASGDAPRGRIDVFSHGFGRGDPPPSQTQNGGGTLTGGSIPAIAFTSQSKTWGQAPSIPAANRLDIEAENIATLTVHPERAQLDCNAALNVTTDGPLTVTLDACNRSEAFDASGG